VIFIVTPNHLQSRILYGINFFKQCNRCDTIINLGRCNQYRKYKPQDIHKNMAFAAIDLLAAIVSVFASHLGRLDRLAVHGTGRRCRFTTIGNTDLLVKVCENLTPHSLLFPFVVMIKNSTMRRKIMGANFSIDIPFVTSKIFRRRFHAGKLPGSVPSRFSQARAVGGCPIPGRSGRSSTLCESLRSLFISLVKFCGEFTKYRFFKRFRQYQFSNSLLS